MLTNQIDGSKPLDHTQHSTAVFSSTRGVVNTLLTVAAGGFLIGWALAVHLGLSVQCQPNCGAVEAGIALSLVGLPIAGGILGYHAFARTTEEVIYRTP